MTDKHSKELRSYNMSRIKGKDTKPEMIVRKFLHSNGLRYRLHDKKLPGKPDIVLVKYRTVIFVNGCFWHRHKGCRYSTIPKTRTEWWLSKLNVNFVNDAENCKKLSEIGWKVVVVWGCELKKQQIQNTLKGLINNFN